MLRNKLRGVHRRISGEKGSAASESDKGTKRKLTISAPTNFTHAAHVSVDEVSSHLRVDDARSGEDTRRRSAASPVDRPRPVISGPMPVAKSPARIIRSEPVVPEGDMQADKDGVLLEGYLQLDVMGEQNVWCRIKAGGTAVVAYTDPSCHTIIDTIPVINLESATVQESREQQGTVQGATIILSYSGSQQRRLTCFSTHKAHLWNRAINTGAKMAKTAKVHRPARAPPAPPTRPPPPPRATVPSVAISTDGCTDHADNMDGGAPSDAQTTLRQQLEAEFEALCISQGLLTPRPSSGSAVSAGGMATPRPSDGAASQASPNHAAPPQACTVDVAETPELDVMHAHEETIAAYPLTDGEDCYSSSSADETDVDVELPAADSRSSMSVVDSLSVNAPSEQRDHDSIATYDADRDVSSPTAIAAVSVMVDDDGESMSHGASHNHHVDAAVYTSPQPTDTMHVLASPEPKSAASSRYTTPIDRDDSVDALHADDEVTEDEDVVDDVQHDEVQDVAGEVEEEKEEEEELFPADGDMSVTAPTASPVKTGVDIMVLEDATLTASVTSPSPTPMDPVPTTDTQVMIDVKQSATDSLGTTQSKNSPEPSSHTVETLSSPNTTCVKHQDNVALDSVSSFTKTPSEFYDDPYVTDESDVEMSDEVCVRCQAVVARYELRIAELECQLRQLQKTT
eukprot:m.18608 g.18608  ORF g.18608 m.18608 type:complete len:684 (+) comp3611_c0_seq1:46-2097(+)